MTLSKGTLLKAVLLGTMALPMLTIPALAQQEVDPTWYDPWAAAPKAAAQSTPAKATETTQPHKMTTATVAAARPKTKKQIQAKAQTKNSGRSERTQAMATAPQMR